MLLSKKNESRDKFLLNTKNIVNEIFKVSIVFYFLFLLIETIDSGFIADYFDLTILVYTIIISGIISMIYKEELEEDNNLKYKISDWIVILILGVGSMFFIFFQIRDLGNLSYYISLLAGIIIILISFFLFKDETNQ